MLSIHRLVFRMVPLVFIALLCGCGADDRRASIYGTITVDGEPLQTGTIGFIPSGENKGPASGASIVAGSYKIPKEKGPFLGTNLVMITSYKSSGRMVPTIEDRGGPPIAEIAQFIPERYNDASELERNVVPGKNEFNFELETGG